MAYTQLPVHNIEIDIPDLVRDATVIKRKAVFISMVYNASHKFVVVNWRIEHFANNGGEPGEKMPYMPDRLFESIADNTTMCRLDTGVPIEKNEDGEYDESIAYTGQYDFFSHLAESQPILVNSMIETFGILINNWDK